MLRPDLAHRVISDVVLYFLIFLKKQFLCVCSEASTMYDAFYIFNFSGINKLYKMSGNIKLSFSCCTMEFPFCEKTSLGVVYTYIHIHMYRCINM